MYKIETHQQLAMLKIFGMWYKDAESVYLKVGKKLIISMLSVSFCASLASGAYLSEDINESIFLSSATVASALLVVKLSYILSKQNEVDEFLN